MIISKNNNFYSILFLCFLTIILLFPFFNKAISSDSIFYIYTAKQILREPLKPFSFQINCSDKNYLGWDVANNPPLISYVLAGVIKIFGEKENVFHLVFFGFTLLSVVGMYFLAEELKVNPFFSALLLLASPAFFVNATDIMLDIPMLAFSLWGIYFVINEKFFGWVLLGFAVLVKFIAVINLPLVFIWLLLNRKLKKNFIFFAIPILFLIAWSVHNKLVYGEIQIFAKSAQVGLSFGLVKEIPLLTYIGGSFIFPLSILWIAFNVKKSNVWIFLIIFSAITFFFNLLWTQPLQNFLFGLFISSAVLLFILFIKKINFQKETIFLFSWFFLYLLFFASVSAIIAVRYLLPVLFAAIMFFVKVSEETPKYKFFLSITSVCGIILSLFLAHSDYKWANSYRDFSKYVQEKYKSEHIYFTGHLGFQYYMEKNGYIAVDSNKKDYKSGSLVVVPAMPVPQKVHPDVIGDLKFIEEKYAFTKNPFRTISPSANAGFHLNMFGLLPYSFSNLPVERFIIYRIK